MKIIMRDGEGANIKLVIPTAVLINRFTALLAPRLLKTHGISITGKQAVALVKELRESKRRHRGWKLVEIHGDDGEAFEITI